MGAILPELISVKVWGHPLDHMGLKETLDFLRENVDPKGHYVEPDRPFSGRCDVYLDERGGIPRVSIESDVDSIEEVKVFLEGLGI